MIEDNVLSVLFSSDNNYVQHMGVAIFSLLKNCDDFERIDIYVIEDEITESNKTKLEQMVLQFNKAKIIWIPFKKWKKQFQLDMQWPISISSYARLLVAEMLPTDVSRVLYMDCDMIVVDSIKKLWNTDLQGKVLGAVQDTVGDSVKSAVGLFSNDLYFNAGLLLIDLQAWRQQNVGGKCMMFINEHQGKVTHHDQGTLNGVLRNNWTKIGLQNNLMTIHYLFSMQDIKKYYGDHAEFYSDSEISFAKENPVILHYTPSFTTRPWVKNCKHPLKEIYWDVIAQTPWNGAKPQKDTSKWYVKLINWRYRKLYW